jgi:hypothetical protein
VTTSLVDANGLSSRAVAARISMALYSPAEPADARMSVRTSTIGFRVPNA